MQKELSASIVNADNFCYNGIERPHKMSGVFNS